MEWDPGPPPTIKIIFEQAPLSEYKNKPNRFRLEWGPMYYRGRLDGTAKLIVTTVNSITPSLILIGSK
jgi:hypothetical protein